MLEVRATDHYAVVCNFAVSDSTVGEGARAYLHAATAFGDNLMVVARSRCDRWIVKWVARKKLMGFRATTVPPGKSLHGGALLVASRELALGIAEELRKVNK